MKECELNIDMHNSLTYATCQDDEDVYEIAFCKDGRTTDEDSEGIPTAVCEGEDGCLLFGYEATAFAARNGVERLSMDFTLHTGETVFTGRDGTPYTGRQITLAFLEHIIGRCQEGVCTPKGLFPTNVFISAPNTCNDQERSELEQALRKRCFPRRKTKISLESTILADDEMRLTSAVVFGDENVVKCLLELGAKPRNGEGETALLVAGELHKYAAAVYLMEHGARKGLQEDDEFGILNEAVRMGNHKALDAIIKCGKAVEFEPDFLLEEAVGSGSLKTVEYLLNHGAFMTPWGTRSYVAKALEISKPEIAKSLLYHYQKKKGYHAHKLLVNEVLEQVSPTCNRNSVDFLIQHGADIHGVNLQGEDFLMRAAAGGRTKEVAFLLKYGLSVHATDKHGKTAWDKAIDSGNLETVECLLNHGVLLTPSCTSSSVAKVLEISKPEIAESLLYHYKQKEGSGAHDLLVNEVLEQVSPTCNRNSVDFLIRHGADIHGVNSQGEDLLMRAAAGGSTKEVAFLLKYGLSVHATDNHGKTAWDKAVDSWSLETVEYLLNHGALLTPWGTRSCVSKALERSKPELAKYFLVLYKQKEGSGAYDLLVNEVLEQVSPTCNRNSVDFLIQHGADIHRVNSQGEDLLMRAAAEGRTKEVAFLLKCGLSVHATDDHGKTAWDKAIQQGHKDTAEYLQNWADRTLLLQAAENGSTDEALLLLKEGAPVDMADKEGCTAMLLAAKAGKWEMVMTLLRHGADANAADTHGNTALLYAAAAGMNKVINALMKRGASSKVSDANGRTPMILATLSGKGSTVKYMTEHGVPIDDADAAGRTALVYALTSQNEKMVKYLLCLGASTEAADTAGRTPLVYAIRTKSWDIVKLLLQYGASPAAKDMKGKAAYAYASGNLAKSIRSYREAFTGLMKAVAAGDCPKIGTYIREVGSADARDTFGRTPLMVAAEANQTDIVKYLLLQGASPAAKDAQGKTVSAYASGNLAKFIHSYEDAFTGLMEAAASGDILQIKVCIRMIGSVDARDTFGRTPLMVAAKANRTDIVKYLLDMGASVSAEDYTGATALQIAVAARSTAAAKLIRNHVFLH